MKAWTVSDKRLVDAGEDLVFADTRNKAKIALLKGNTALDSILANDPDREYMNIKAIREPELDNHEKESPMQLVELLILKCGWSWYNTEGGQIWDSSNFDKAEFEKDWTNSNI